jgi:uncharacterized protein YndB with AHSA1/START domain
MEIAIDDKTSLQIRRVYKAPVAAVYAAWTDPEQMKHWMGPSARVQTLGPRHRARPGPSAVRRFASAG